MNSFDVFVLNGETIINPINVNNQLIDVLTNKISLLYVIKNDFLYLFGLRFELQLQNQLNVDMHHFAAINNKIPFSRNKFFFHKNIRTIKHLLKIYIKILHLLIFVL